MFPLRDINKAEKPPILTRILVVINITVFIYTLLNPNYEAIIGNYGFRPIYLYSMEHLETLFTSMFLHGGFEHIIGNMWFLWIFGDNVEDKLGRAQYMILYFLSGIFGSILFTLTSADPYIVAIGASGAVSGVLGAYLVLFPNARILTLIPIGYYFYRIVEIRAIYYIFIWFIMQALFASITLFTLVNLPVAYWAHIGGFIIGLIFGIIKRLGYNNKPLYQYLAND